MVRPGPRGWRSAVIQASLAEAYSSTGAAWEQGPARVYDRLAEALVRLAPVPLAERTVLDIGAGTGAATRAISAVGGIPIATDVAVGMLRAIAHATPPCVAADARSLPFVSRSVGGIVAAFSFNHLPDPERALREAARVVERGGPLLASAYASDDSHPVKDAVNAAAAEIGWTPEPWVEQLRNDTIPRLATVDRATAVAAAAGLRDVEVHRLEVAYPDLSARDLIAWRCGMAQLAPFMAGLAPRDQDRLRARAVELLGPSAPLVRRVIVIAAVA